MSRVLRDAEKLFRNSRVVPRTDRRRDVINRYLRPTPSPPVVAVINLSFSLDYCWRTVPNDRPLSKRTERKGIKKKKTKKGIKTVRLIRTNIKFISAVGFSKLMRSLVYFR